ncbi:hypothetical protein Cba03nite_28880 [Catellatospora bangladeshensis]|uniref:Uncharacterized protein n=1 Tax=Catellatospora bangladeshensis TaxID=310355 RepID=A0A8J3JF85_9ACTN|nr:hypothetical protein Cba03nite_28880 [Catellatospora bangladeshensis]
MSAVKAAPSNRVVLVILIRSFLRRSVEQDRAARGMKDRPRPGLGGRGIHIALTKKVSERRRKTATNL